METFGVDELPSSLPFQNVQEDIRSFVRPQTYRLVVSLFSSFGYFEDRTQDMRVLRNVYQSLEEEGVFLLDMMGKEALARRFQPALVHEVDDGATLFEKVTILNDWSRVRTEWVLLRGESVRRHTVALNLYSAQELKVDLKEAGFRNVAVYGDLAGNPYDAEATRLIAVAVNSKDDVS